MKLSVTARRTGDAAVITLRGDVDNATSGRVRMAITAFLHASPALTTLHIDLAAVDEIDMIGLGTLVVACRISDEVGVPLLFCHARADLAARLLAGGVPPTHLSNHRLAAALARPISGSAPADRTDISRPAGEGPGRTRPDQHVTDRQTR